MRRRADYLRHVVSEIDAREAQAGRGRGPPGRGPAAEPGRRAGRAGAAHRGCAGGRRRQRARRGERGRSRARARWRRSIPRSRAGGRCSTPPTPTSPSWRGSPRRTPAEVQEDPERLAEVERRRDVLFRLTQKYGATLEAVLAARDAAAAELDLLDTADVDLRALARPPRRRRGRSPRPRPRR